MDIIPGKLSLLRAWLDDTPHDYSFGYSSDDKSWIRCGQAHISVEYDGLGPQEVMISYEIEIEPLEEPEDPDELPENKLGSKYVIINLADPGCFDDLSRVIEEGDEANVPWQWEKAE
jgi:hypothetical protein